MDDVCIDMNRAPNGKIDYGNQLAGSQCEMRLVVPESTFGNIMATNLLVVSEATFTRKDPLYRFYAQ